MVHYVIYTRISKVVVLGIDPQESTREICLNDECETYDTHTTKHIFHISGKTTFTFTNIL